MDLVLRSPQLHNLFGNLGFIHGDTYHVNENCNATLESILANILSEDKYLRSFRRSISFGQNIQKDIIPLFLHAKDDKTTELIMHILVNLTIPIECLLSFEVISNTDFGRHTVHELDNLLSSTKVAFTDQRATKAIVEFLKKNIETDQMTKLSSKQCTNINNSLLLLRNLLHIPEDVKTAASHNLTGHACQNQIIWNIFSQGIDKHLIKLMNIPEAHNWGVTMVQVIALLYKDQHVVTLQKLLNMWLEASLSESSDDNESNTSPPPPNRGRPDSSSIPSSDPTSDSSDTGGGGGGKLEGTGEKCGWGTGDSDGERPNIAPQPQHSELEAKDEPVADTTDNVSMSCESARDGQSSSNSSNSVKMTQKIITESSDCGYGTQIENQEVSTSSNEDEMPAQKPVHQKPLNPKQRTNKTRDVTTVQEKKTKKIVKRGKANIINVQGLLHKTPNNDDISHVLKEFTVDFLLKGYNSLVRTLYTQIMTNVNLEIDVSHFLWLVTYFLKFATQIELGLEHLHSVLSYDIVAYLTAEGVNLCELFDLAIKMDGNDLKPCIRRQHLVVTAIRELIQAIEAYKKTLVNEEDKKALLKLQLKICDTEELRSLFVLLIRNYSSWHHSKQYLQDLIVTNHFLLMFLDSTMKMPEYKGAFSMHDHIKQFATVDVMRVYGVMLEEFAGNGEFVNDCIFTLMHHVGGEHGSLASLYQPNILKTFTNIWKIEFDICDDWSDLIEYVINTFVNKPPILHNITNINFDYHPFGLDLKDGEDQSLKQMEITNTVKRPGNTNSINKDKWTDDEISVLSWNFMQCKSKPDVVGELVRLLKEDRVHKSRLSVINQLRKQDIITQHTYEEYKDSEKDKDTREDEIGKICEQLIADGKEKFLVWVQRVLLETCYIKLQLTNIRNKESLTQTTAANSMLYEDNSTDFHAMSPVSYHCLNLNQSIPLVTWNCEQAAVCKDLMFLQLLNKLGFCMPVDSDKVFIRIPHFWTADSVFSIACRISPKHNTKLKFMVQSLSNCYFSDKLDSASLGSMFRPGSESNNLYQVQTHSKLPSAVNFTPTPGCSFTNAGDQPSAEIDELNWLDVIRRSQDISLNKSPECFLIPPPRPAPQFPLHLADDDDDDSECDTALMASDLTRMYVSDEEDKPEPPVRPVHHRRTSDSKADIFTDNSDSECTRRKRVCHRLNKA